MKKKLVLSILLVSTQLMSAGDGRGWAEVAGAGKEELVPCKLMFGKDNPITILSRDQAFIDFAQRLEAESEPLPARFRTPNYLDADQAWKLEAYFFDPTRFKTGVDLLESCEDDERRELRDVLLIVSLCVQWRQSIDCSDAIRDEKQTQILKYVRAKLQRHVAQKVTHDYFSQMLAPCGEIPQGLSERFNAFVFYSLNQSSKLYE